jgi:hypothetical protein
MIVVEEDRPRVRRLLQRYLAQFRRDLMSLLAGPPKEPREEAVGAARVIVIVA